MNEWPELGRSRRAIGLLYVSMTLVDRHTSFERPAAASPSTMALSSGRRADGERSRDRCLYPSRVNPIPSSKTLCFAINQHRALTKRPLVQSMTR